jgi:hypothetical protein
LTLANALKSGSSERLERFPNWCVREARAERAFRDCVATGNEFWRWNKTIKIRSQPRSGGIGVSRGRKPAVKWKNNGAAQPGSPLRAAFARNGVEERRHRLRDSLFRPAFPGALYFAFAAEVRDLSGESGFLFWLADAALKRSSTQTSADAPTVELL